MSKGVDRCLRGQVLGEVCQYNLVIKFFHTMRVLTVVKREIISSSQSCIMPIKSSQAFTPCGSSSLVRYTSRSFCMSAFFEALKPLSEIFCFNILFLYFLGIKIVKRLSTSSSFLERFSIFTIR